jgi:glycerol-3-phosphate O-acyltransferase
MTEFQTGSERAAPTRFGTAMLRHFGWFYYLLGLGHTLRHLKLSDVAAERIRTASQRGPIVYVMPHPSTIDHLALNTVLNRWRLPLSVWADGAPSFYWQPVWEAWTDAWWRFKRFFSSGPAPDPIESGWVSSTVARGRPITVFAHWRVAQSPHDSPHPLQALLDAQAQCDEPIQVLPLVVVWNRAPETSRDPVRRFFEASRRFTGVLEGLWNAWTRSRGAFILVGEPLSLKPLSERFPPNKRVGALSRLLVQAVRTEDATVRGPRLLPYRDFKRVVLENPPMRRFAEEEAKASGVEPAAIQKKMDATYDRIAARFKFKFIQALSVVLRPLWTRVFSGVDVPEEDLERIRSAMRKGTAVLVPCHKSHLDYVLLSWVMLRHGLIVPHIVAGINLAIWPISIILRGSGAFFVQRQIQGDRIFRTVFTRYLRELVIHGYPLEFFIEGGRTRSGKLLPPKTGVLDMVLEASNARSTGREVTLLPVAFAYEQVAEEKAYARELGGEKKRPETLGQLLRASSILKHRYGKVYLRVGTGLPCSDLVDARPERPAWNQRDPQERYPDLYRMGERIIHRVGEVMVVLPTSVMALALLAHHRRGVRESELLARAQRLLEALQRQGAPAAASLSHPNGALVQALDRFLRNHFVETFHHEGERIWSIVPDKRITLEFYKNQVLHHLCAAGYATIAIRRLGKDQFRREELRESFILLLWVFRREFVLDPDLTATEHLDRGLETLTAYGALHEEDGTYTIGNVQYIGEIYGLWMNFVEGYAAVLTQAPHLEGGPRSPKEAAKTIQQQREALINEGKILRPESLSLATLQNAIRTLSEDGVFETNDTNITKIVEPMRARRLEEFESMKGTS